MVFFLLIFPLLFNIIIAQLNEDTTLKIEWTCSESAIDIVIKTTNPFFGLVHPKREPWQKHTTDGCAFHGTGQQKTELRIPLDGNGTEWQDCGLQLEIGTSTIWAELEVHEHPLLIMDRDRTVNISCVGWTDLLSRQQEQENNSPFHLVFRPANSSSANVEQMSPANHLQFGNSYELLVYGPIGQTIEVHSCEATSLDRNARIQLINSAGCSLNLNMMSDFHVLGNSPSHLPSSSLPPPSSSSSTMNNFPHRVAMASAQFPSMFRFNSAITTTPELIRFECIVKPCEAIEEQAPCGQKPSDCESQSRISLRQKDALEETRTQPQVNRTDNEANNSGLELITQLLSNEEATTEEPNEDPQLHPTSIKEGNFDVTTVASINRNYTGNERNTGPIVKVRNSNTSGGWHRVRTMVRVMDWNQQSVTDESKGNNKRTMPIGWINAQSSSIGNNNSESGTITVATASSHRNGTAKIDEQLPKTTNSTSSSAIPPTPLVIFNHSVSNADERSRANVSVRSQVPFLRDFISRSATTLTPSSSLPSNSSSISLPSSSTFSPSASAYCISAEQLLRLYQICIGLCVLFLLGCCCNLLMCCFNRRCSSSKTHHSPLRLKRGRRQQSVLISTNAPTSNSTLSSSLYGPGNVMNGGDKKEKATIERKEVNQFWISDEGKSGVGGASSEIASENHFGPMLSSIYGALPLQPPPSASYSSTSGNRRSSVHSYASVKAPHHSTQRTINNQQHNLLLNSIPNRLSTSQQQHVGNELIQQSSLSPAHSPSTTTSSSAGGSHLYPSQFSRTFHPPQNAAPHNQQQMGGTQQKQTPSSLASSVRSSTLGTPSLSDTDPTGASTPRPSSSDLVMQQQLEQDETGQSQQSSTFVRPNQNFVTTHSFGQCQQNESFSIL